MSEHDLLELLRHVSAPGATAVTLEPEIVAWLVNEIFRLDSLWKGLATALEDRLVEDFATELDASDGPPA